MGKYRAGPSPAATKTPSGMMVWKWTFRLRPDTREGVAGARRGASDAKRAAGLAEMSRAFDAIRASTWDASPGRTPWRFITNLLSNAVKFGAAS
jgi:hypothetical protein